MGVFEECYLVIIVVFHRFNMGVTLVLKGLYLGLPRMLNRCFRGVTGCGPGTRNSVQWRLLYNIKVFCLFNLVY